MRSARTQQEGQSEAQPNHQLDNFFREITQSNNDGRTSDCIYLSKEAPPAPARIKPAFDKESPQLLPRQPPAHCGNSNVTISTQRICFLRFCKSEFPVRLMGIYSTEVYPSRPPCQITTNHVNAHSQEKI